LIDGGAQISLIHPKFLAQLRRAGLPCGRFLKGCG
jgi:hypothetical protein